MPWRASNMLRFSIPAHPLRCSRVSVPKSGSLSKVPGLLTIGLGKFHTRSSPQPGESQGVYINRAANMSFWTCPSCTYVNQVSSVACDMCQQPRKPAPRQANSSSIIGQANSTSKWGCRACTFLNKDSDNVCDICGTARSAISLDSFAEIDLSLDEDEGIVEGGAKFWPLRACTVSQTESHNSNIIKPQPATSVGIPSAPTSISEKSETILKKRKAEDHIPGSMEPETARPVAISNSLLGQVHHEKLLRKKHSDVDEEAPSGSASLVPSLASESSSLGNDSQLLVILTYNVWFREDLELLARMNAIGAIILEHNPHFVCFQEVTPNIYNIFQRAVWWERYKCSVSPVLASKRAYFCLQLSRMPNVTFHRKPFHNSVMGRELCIAKANVIGGRELIVATTHLESPCPAPPKWDQMFSPERVSQATESLNLLKDSPNVFFGGDMNWDDKLDGMPPLPEGWRDAWTSLRNEEEGITYDSKANPMLTGSRLRKRLDRIFCHLQHFGLESIEMVGTNPIPGVTFAKEMKVKKQTQKVTLPVLPSDHFGLLLKMSHVT